MALPSTIEARRTRAAQAALLASEAAMLARVRAAVQIVIDQHKSDDTSKAALNAAINDTAQALQRHIPAVLAAGMQNTRAAAMQTVWDDLTALRRHLQDRGESDNLPDPPIPQPKVEQDHRRTREPVASLAAAFGLAALTAHAAKQDSVGSILGIAKAATDHRIDRIVAAENTRVFNEERVTGLQDQQVQIRWDATLDERTCGDCVDLDGETIAPGEMFTIPSTLEDIAHPPAHVNCRCVAVMVIPK